MADFGDWWNWLWGNKPIGEAVSLFLTIIVSIGAIGSGIWAVFRAFRKRPVETSPEPNPRQAPNVPTWQSPNFPPLPPYQAFNKSKICFSRIDDINIYYNNSMQIYVDGKWVGSLGNKGLMELFVEPGRHAIYAKIQLIWFKSKIIYINVNPGQTCYLACNASPWYLSAVYLEEQYPDYR